MAVFEGRTSKEVIKVNEVVRVGSSFNRISVLIRDTKELTHALIHSFSLYAQPKKG